MVLKRIPIPDIVTKLVKYDPETGVLSRKTTREVKFSQSTEHVYHKRISPGGYISIWIKGTTYYGHRIAWFLMTGEQPPVDIDHRDRDKGNNKWSNLRAATRADNIVNRRHKVRDLPVGVDRTADGQYRSRISRNGTRYVLGSTFKNPDDAHAAYLLKAVVLHGEFSSVLAGLVSKPEGVE